MADEDLISRVRAETRALARATSGRRLDPILATELTLQQLKIVLLVAGGEATTGSCLAETLRVSAPTVSAIVDRLVELGYLSRAEDETDRRVKVLRPTSSGRRLYEAVLDRRGASLEVLSLLSTDDLEALLRGLTAWRAAYERVEAGRSV